MERLLNLVSIRSGQVDPKLPQYRDMPLVAPDHIESGTGRLLATRSAKEQGAISGKYVVNPGDIIYSKIRPYLMKAYRADFHALCSADMYALAPRRGADGRYILNLLLGRVFTNFAIGESMRSGIPKINREGLAGYELLVPPDSEQQMIGAALEDTDVLVYGLEKLLVKKRAIKQGMMQELLTGRTRLPSFTGEWSTRRLSTLGTFLRGSGIKRDQVRPSGVPCIRYGEIYTTFDDYTASTVSFVDQAVAATSLPLAYGDILFAGSGETKSEIGMNVAYIGDAPAVAGGDIIVLRGIDYDPVYLATLLNTPEVAVQKARGGQGDAVVHINWRVLAGIEVKIPRLAEQRAIAQVLIDADAETKVLERRLEATKAIKQGMMQELLTGRTRLPVKEDAV
ncbi:restriction endonuclease subunit S [Pseudoclavibacter sp. VKM Ac-2888]|uniref:restriction endonuclease subunit S n=1 Tax=Pseudoclavibacter sp. VKM Ac-2888 TaxID=2783830 RepID=UPI00188C168E|nr:restriction endonuclease subunit S [Pseudoclavibacter sp. VKM Ac-2888]MBF4548700.1 restriction endonuclease subunit S [Pseudoclavibacter sp. VKM Ac-2888]